MGATAKQCKVYTVFAWQVLFQCGVYRGWACPKQRVGLGAIECSLGVGSVCMGAEGCVLEEWGKGVQFSFAHTSDSRHFTIKSEPCKS